MLIIKSEVLSSGAGLISRSIPSSAKYPFSFATYRPVWLVLIAQSRTKSTFLSSFFSAFLLTVLHAVNEIAKINAKMLVHIQKVFLL